MESGRLPVFQSVAPPAFGVCGAIKAERRALLAFLVQELVGYGLKAVVIREASSQGQEQESSLPCDLILVEGDHRLPAMIWLDDGGKLPPEAGGALRSFGTGKRREKVLDFLLEWITRVWQQTPVWGCVLIGGRSSRMGQPKHLLTDQHGTTWLERTAHLLQPLVSNLVLSGKGDVPESLQDLIRLPDIPGIAGPLSGILSAMRRHPSVSWLLVACDMPDIQEDAVRWLLSRRRPGVWGTVPRLQEDGHVEPLLAHYDFRCAPLFEDLVRTDCLRIGMVAENTRVETPLVPERLRSSWRNVNIAEELQADSSKVDGL
jgi:molybdopterin-guanine dinucleotide biosynthesis protein A